MIWIRGSWRRGSARLPLRTTAQLTADELKQRLDAGQIRLRDVRQPAERAEDHVPGAMTAWKRAGYPLTSTK